MSELGNLQTVRRIGEAVGEGDLPRILSLCTDDLEILPALSHRFHGPVRGVGGKKLSSTSRKSLMRLSFRSTRWTNSSLVITRSLCLATSDALFALPGAWSRLNGCRFLTSATGRSAVIANTRIRPLGTLDLRANLSHIAELCTPTFLHQPIAEGEKVSLGRAAPRLLRSIQPTLQS
jgi:hypothetical protein